MYSFMHCNGINVCIMNASKIVRLRQVKNRHFKNKIKDNRNSFINY